MTWWQVLINWLMFQAILGLMQTGQTEHSPSFSVVWQDGKRFEVSIHATRTA